MEALVGDLTKRLSTVSRTSRINASAAQKIIGAPRLLRALALVLELDKLVEKNAVNLIMTVSMPEDEASDDLRKFM